MATLIVTYNYDSLNLPNSVPIDSNFLDPPPQDLPECPVCFYPKKLTKLMCNHEFCDSCIQKWKVKCNKNPTCPICRTRMLRDPSSLIKKAEPLPPLPASVESRSRSNSLTRNNFIFTFSSSFRTFFRSNSNS